MRKRQEMKNAEEFAKEAIKEIHSVLASPIVGDEGERILELIMPLFQEALDYINSQVRLTKTAEEFAQKALDELDALYGDDDNEIVLIKLFQLALDTPVPVKFVDGFVPDEEGKYWFQYSKEYEPEIVFVIYDIDCFRFTCKCHPQHLKKVKDTPGRFTYRITPPENEE